MRVLGVATARLFLARSQRRGRPNKQEPQHGHEQDKRKSGEEKVEIEWPSPGCPEQKECRTAQC